MRAAGDFGKAVAPQALCDEVARLNYPYKMITPSKIFFSRKGAEDAEERLQLCGLTGFIKRFMNL
jgi:hypothetical protein